MAPLSSKQPAGGGPSGFSNWDCHICGLANNWGWRARCRRCEAYPSPSARRPLGASDQRGPNRFTSSGFANASSRTGGSASRWGGSQTLAEKQVQAQKQEAKQQQQARELAEAKKKTQELRDEIKRLRVLADGRNSGNADPEEMDGLEGPPALTEEQRQAQIAQVRAGLPYLENRYGKDAEPYLAAVSELESLQKASREAKPYKTHRAQLERRVEKLQRQQESDKKKEEEAEQQIEALQSSLVELREAIKDRDKALAAAEAGLKELLRTAIGDDDADGEDAEPGEKASQSWNTVVAAASRLASRPGVPGDLATQLQGLFTQLQTVVMAMEGAAAGHEAQAHVAHQQQMQQLHQEQMQLQAQMAQHHQSLQGHAAVQPHSGTPAPLEQPPSAEGQRAEAAAPPASQPPPATRPANAEDFIALAMAPTPASGGAGAASSASTGLPSTSSTPPASAAADGGPQPPQPPTPACAAAAISDGDQSSEDDMDSVCGELELQDGESEQQRKTRIAKHLKERERRRREARKKEGRDDKRKELGASSGSKEACRVIRAPSTKKK